MDSSAFAGEKPIPSRGIGDRSGGSGREALTADSAEPGLATATRPGRIPTELRPGTKVNQPVRWRTEEPAHESGLSKEDIAVSPSDRNHNQQCHQSTDQEANAASIVPVGNREVGRPIQDQQHDRDPSDDEADHPTEW
jgi:hypothetical protein